MNIFLNFSAMADTDCKGSELITPHALDTVTSSSEPDRIPTSNTISTLLKSKNALRRPLLVKQKPSFGYPDEDTKTSENIETIDTDTSSKEEERMAKEPVETTNHNMSVSLVIDEPVIDDKRISKSENSKNEEKSFSPPPFVTRISFEDLKEEVRLMPTFPPPDFVRTGSDDSGGSRAQTRYVYSYRYHCIFLFFLEKYHYSISRIK